MNRLLLIRHGENTANLTLEFSHHRVDYSLTPRGVLQAQQTAAFLRDQGIQEVYSSPLKRAVETAEIIAAPLGLPVIVLEAFREVNVGDLENQPPTPELWMQHNAIITGWYDGHPETCFPDGENMHTLVARARAGFEEVLAGKDGRTIVIVAHGGIFNFSLFGLLPGVSRETLRGGIANCAITEIEAAWVNDHLEARLVSYASAGHISGEAAKFAAGIFSKEKTR